MGNETSSPMAMPHNGATSSNARVRRVRKIKPEQHPSRPHTQQPYNVQQPRPHTQHPYTVQQPRPHTQHPYTVLPPQQPRQHTQQPYTVPPQQPNNFSQQNHSQQSDHHPHQMPTLVDTQIVQNRNDLVADSRALIMGNRAPITADNYHDQERQFNEKMHSDERKFKERQRKEREQFKRGQSNARRQFERELNQFKDNYDPYAILGVKRGIDMKKLKKAYRKLAKKHHPDKGGSAENFELITKSYLFIEREMEAGKQKSHFDMKRGAEQFRDNRAPVESVHVDKKNFNVKKFNHVFEQHRVSTNNDRGYGEMMSGGAREDTPMIEDKRGKLFTKDFNLKVFNKMFEDDDDLDLSDDEDEEAVMQRGGRVVVYKEPEALTSGHLKFTELGEGEIKDFTGTSDNNRLQYTDYMQGYVKQNRLINPNKVEMRKNYKNVNDLKLERSKVSYDLSDHDRALIERQKMLDQQYEDQRVGRVSKQDQLYEEHFNRMNQIFIKR